MTADHAGQTGGERECLCGHTHGLHVAPSGRTTRCWVIACRCSGYAPSARPSRPVPVPGQAASERGVSDRSDATGDQTGQAARERDTAAPERDTTVPSAAREAAVEAVARWVALAVANYGEAFASCYDNPPDLDWDLVARDFVEGCDVGAEILALPEVAALSAAPGQVWGGYEPEPGTCGGGAARAQIDEAAPRQGQP